jgi:hypothetical protein
MAVAEDMHDHMEIERVEERGQGVGKEVIGSSAGLRMDEAWVAGEGRLCRTWRLVGARRDSVPFCRNSRGDLLGRSPGCVRSLCRSLLRSLYPCLCLLPDNEVGLACKVDEYLAEATSKSDGSVLTDPGVY